MSRRSVVRAPAPASTAVSFPLQRKCCGSQSRTQEDDDTGSALGVQSKLTIGARGDAYEREADAVAERAIQADSTPGEPPRITPLVQRKSTGGSASARTAGMESELRSRRGQGASLPETTRGSMEERFGVDFSRVRIHADPAAHRLTAELDSLAFTQGSDIYFSGDQYRPGTEAGDRLLAHELTHVVQQGGGSSGRSPYIQRDDKTEEGTGDDDKTEEGTEDEEPEQETKSYYSINPSHPLLGARGPLLGKDVHNLMENRLRTYNPALVTEAPIPAATQEVYFEETSDRWTNFTKLGRADLYMSSIPNGICGIRGRLSKETLQEDYTKANTSTKGARTPARWLEAAG